MPVGYGLVVEMKWQAADPGDDEEGDAPPDRRSGHTFTCVPDSTGDENDRRGILFGGKAVRSAGPAITNDLYQIDLESNEWKKAAFSKGPEPRAKHSAVVVAPGVVCVFGGTNLTHRLNDCWLLNTDTMSWSEAYPEGTAGVPSPRSGHAACTLDGKMYVIFGYGGLGYSRRDLADISVLEMETKTWSSLNPDGEPPLSRSEHQASVVEKKIFITGGWNSSAQLSDIHILDTETKAWSEVAEDFVFDRPRWDHSSVAVWAVPNWKVFIFGGNSGDLADSPQGVPLNDITVIDTGSMTLAAPTMMQPNCTGEAPCARSDTELLYDQVTNR